jgi:hypothetical protein
MSDLKSPKDIGHDLPITSSALRVFSETFSFYIAERTEGSRPSTKNLVIQGDSHG